MTKQETTTKNCNVTLRLATLNLGIRTRDNRMLSPFSFTQVVQSVDDLRGGNQDYIKAVTREAKELANTTFCHHIDGDDLLIDLTFIGANSLGPSAAELLKLPRHGYARLHADTGVLQAVFVLSRSQAIMDMYALHTGDDSEPKGIPHADLRGQPMDPSEVTPAHVKWLNEGVKHLPEDERAKAIEAKVSQLLKNTDDAYIAVASTFLKNAKPNTGFKGGYGFNNLVGPEIAKRYKTNQ